MKRFLVIILAAFTFASCFNEGDASIIAIYAAPSSNSVSSGEKMYFDVQVTTANQSLTRFEIETFDSMNGSRKIYTATPGTQSFKDRVVYEALAVETDSTFVEFNFKAEDNTGEQAHITMKIKVYGGGGTLLPEISGIVLYSPWSGKEDAFSFTTMQPLHSATNEPENIDLRLIAPNQDAMNPLNIGTDADITFARANNFDYASATWSGLQSVFMNSVRTNIINNVNVDDIILVGRETLSEDTNVIQTLGVIRIMNVYDEAGSNSDKVVMNLKTLRRQ